VTKRVKVAPVPLGERSYHPAELPNCERDYKRGDKTALAHAIAICACTDIKLPEWAAHAYLGGYRAAVPGVRDAKEFPVKSWDDVLGKPLPKGAQANARAKQRQKEFLVWVEVQRHRTQGGSVTDDELEHIGRKFHIGRTLAKEYYGREETRMRQRVSLFPNELNTKEAVRLLTKKAIEALDRSESAPSARERAAARIILMQIRGRFQALFTIPPDAK